MHINVRDLLVKDLGYSRTFGIEGEEPEMLSVTLTQPVNGSFTATKLDTSSLATEGEIYTQIELECHRCLRSYVSDVEARFDQVFAQQPNDDELPIVKDQIDLAPVIEEEIILSLPIKLLCQDDCDGVAGAETYLKKGN